MRVRILASHKEGTGKTTLAAPLAGEARRTGAGPVAVVKTDPRGHYAPWWNTRVAEIPLSAALTLPQLPARLPLLRGRPINLVILATRLLRIKIRETSTPSRMAYASLHGHAGMIAGPVLPW